VTREPSRLGLLIRSDTELQLGVLRDQVDPRERHSANDRTFKTVRPIKEPVPLPIPDRSSGRLTLTVCVWAELGPTALGCAAGSKL
jgi:hypothetical protein